MRTQLLTSIALGMAASLLVLSGPIKITAQDTAGPTGMTSWSEPDLQGIWTAEFDTPLQRPAQYANQKFFTEAQRAEYGLPGLLRGRRTEELAFREGRGPDPAALDNSRGVASLEQDPFR